MNRADTPAPAVRGAPMTAPSRMFRVLSGKLRGQILPEDDVCVCERCDIEGGSADCGMCGGVGFVLGYPMSGPPHRLELVEDIARSEDGNARASGDGNTRTLRPGSTPFAA